MLKLIIALALVAGALQITMAESDSEKAPNDSTEASAETDDSDSDEDGYECEPEPPKCTGPNEIYDPCDNPCPARRCDFDPTVVRCKSPPEVGDEECLIGCRCQDGYLRNAKGVCVAKDQCPKKCGANEIYDPCPDCSPQTCSTVGKRYNCPMIPSNSSDPRCKGACRCQKGYARDNNNICVLIKNCPKECGTNEVYDPCPDCSPQTCSTLNQTFNCPLIPSDPSDPRCKGACRCQKGYARDVNNTCVPVKNCPKECGTNEVYDPCPDCSPQTCSTLNQTFHCPLIPSDPSDPRCKGACRCEKGYARDNNNDCVPVENCSKCKKANEVYDPCPGCSPQTCETKNQTYFCPLMKCKGTCRCQRGYFRNKIGECISAANCDKCSGPHEYFSCGSACDNKCDSKYGQDNCNIQNIVCNKMCYCEKGYSRATNGTCIPKKDCQYECPKNERYEKCPDNICGPKTCSAVGFPSAPCPITNEGDPCPGKPGCVCNDGYLRNSKGVCVPSTECPSCGGDKNATLGCGINCGRLCSNYKRKDIACILLCRTNACDCRKDYVYDSNTKQCVLPKDCTPVCKTNEVYSTCINGGCQKKKCTDLNKPKICVHPKDCIVGCLCADGYLRAKNGTCVPIDQCDAPKPVCKENEEFSKCGLDGCKKRYCSDLELPPLCRDTFSCDPACECKDGYLRASTSNNTCVPVDQCPPVSCNGDKNARPGCGVHCGNRCSNYKDRGNVACPAICMLDGCDCKEGFVFDDNTQLCVKPEECTPTCGVNEEYSNCSNGLCRVQQCSDKGKQRPCPPMVPGSCIPGCVCPEKYLRSTNGTCVPEDQCDVPAETCPKNEILVSCPQALCKPETCAQAGMPVACPRYAKCPGKPGCVCSDGYYRDSEGVCIPQKDCPSCNGDENAVPGCGVNCGRRCSDYNSTEGAACPDICNLNGCDCKEGFVLDDQTNKCVKPEKCSPSCGVNEEFSQCSNGLCRVQDCSEKGKQRPCPPMVPGSCTPGCICPEKYLRSKNGTCVPEDQCDVPAEPTCPTNEVYSKCPESMCQPETCAQAGFPVPCPIIGPDGQCPGKPRCVCNGATYRNSDGVCVPKNQCPSCGGDENAIPGCGVNCGRLCSNYNNTRNVICPLFCNINGCDCKKGYVFDSNTKKCVLPNKCTPTCGVNEEFSECSNGLCRVQQCSDKGKDRPCPPMVPGSCTPGCVCPEKYLRASNGTCVPEDQCDVPTACPEGETFDKCPPPKCDGEYCPRTRDDPQTCPYPNNDTSQCGKPRCVCGFNSHRDRKTGKCIATSQCPAFACDGPNESFNSCVPVCPGETCTDYLKNATCPRFRIGIVVPCKLGCRCDKGYYRNSNNICIEGPKCKGATTSPPQADSCDAEAQQKALRRGNTALNGKFLYQVMKNNPDKSVFVSAFSAFIPMAQLFLYSNGSTFTQLASLLNVPNKSDIRCGFPGLLNSVKATNGTILNVAAKIYVYNKGKLSKQLEKDSKNVFNASAQTVDFSDGAKTSEIINKWVSDATDGEITKLVNADSFDPNTVLALVNAILFKGLWKYKFDANNTKPRDFYVNSNKTIQVPTMYQKGNFRYGQLSDPGVQILEMPCKDENITVVVVLPNDKDGAVAVAEKMQDPDVYENMLNSLSSQSVNVYLPKINIETSTDVKEVLKAIGVEALFDPSEAELSGMTDPDAQLYVSKAIQKALVKMDEEGAVAAAATGVIGRPGMPAPPPIQIIFNANRPFLFSIKCLDVVLFSGLYHP